MIGNHYGTLLQYEDHYHIAREQLYYHDIGTNITIWEPLSQHDYCHDYHSTPIEYYPYLKLHITPFASPTWPLDLQHSVTVGVLDSEPWEDEAAVLVDVPDNGAGGWLHLNVLQTAETAPARTAVRTLKVDHLG